MTITIGEMIKSVGIEPRLPPIPANGVAFTLTFNAADVDPFDMVRAIHHNPEKWKLNGEPLADGIHTGRFEWVSAGHQKNLEAVITELEKYGRVPRWYWLNAVLTSFDLPYRGHSHCLAVADPFLISPDGKSDFSGIFNGSNSCNLYSVDHRRDDFWRWLVESSR